MTQFMSKSFSVAMGLNEQGRKNYERIFGKKRKPSGKSARPTAGMKARSKAADADDRAKVQEAGLDKVREAASEPYPRGARW